jgi:transposase
MAWRRGQAYSQDLRDRVLKAEGSNSEVAARFDVSQSYVSRVRSRQRQLGRETAGEQRNHVAPRLASVEQALAERVAAANDLTLKQLVQWVDEEHGIHTSIAAMWTTLRRLGLTLKKSRCMPANNSATT